MQHFYIHVPGWVYAMDVYGINEQDARKKFREQQGFSRLPKGTAVWKA